MRYLMEEDADKYKTEFANFIKEEVAADDLEDLYTSVHEAIREDPSPSEKEEFEPDKEYKNKAKKSYEDRKASVEEKKAAMTADDEEEEDEDEDDEE
jgi:large subunit ribosomal protein L5e